MLIDFPVGRESEQRQRETGGRKEAVRVEIGNAWQEAVLANEETLSHCKKAFAIWQICLLISEFGSSKCCWPQSLDCCSTVGESTEIRMTVIHATHRRNAGRQRSRRHAATANCCVLINVGFGPHMPQVLSYAQATECVSCRSGRWACEGVGVRDCE